MPCRIFLSSYVPLPYAIRTLQNIHVVTEGEKTTSLPSKSSLSSSFLLSLFFLPFSLLRPFYTMPLIIRRGRSRVQYWEWHNIGSPSDIAKVCEHGGGERWKGKGERGRGVGDRGDETQSARPTDAEREKFKFLRGCLTVQRRRRSITIFIILTTYVRSLRHLC